MSCQTFVHCKATEAEYLERVQSTLPLGNIWQIDKENSTTNPKVRIFSGYWQAVASLLTEAHNQLCELIDELFPCSSQTLLNRHAEIYGYPIDCIGYPENADQLCEWIELINSNCYGPNIGFFKNLIEFAKIDYVDDVFEQACPSLSAVDWIDPNIECDELVASDSFENCLIEEKEKVITEDCQKVQPAGCGVAVADVTLPECAVVIKINDKYKSDQSKSVGCCFCVGESICPEFDSRIMCLLERFLIAGTPIIILNSSGTWAQLNENKE